MVHPHVTAIGAKKQKVAEVMSQRMQFPITADKVTLVGKDPDMEVYASQYDDFTVACWAHTNGEFIVRYIYW